MRFDDFRLLVERLLKEVPPAYVDGVVVVEVSPKAVPHPVRGDVYTLGECIPLEWSGNGANLQSREMHSPNRSEEHTSELQSRQYLVCRLLLEKKKIKQTMKLPNVS